MTRQRPTLSARIAATWVWAALLWGVLSYVAVVWPVGILVQPPALAVGLILILLTIGGAFWAFAASEVIRRLRADAIESSVRAAMGLLHD
ncbi:membrane protein [Microbacterium phage Cen1621]|uniref:Membrane protein n=1 Tax=Microbacterium phage Cen1621 TaxID=2965191 RepID=A0A9E7QAD4_9CAUD|nr:membrane protein [Microbacterium phage Cen1621]